MSLYLGLSTFRKQHLIFSTSFAYWKHVARWDSTLAGSTGPLFFDLERTEPSHQYWELHATGRRDATEMGTALELFLPSLTLTHSSGCVKSSWGNYINKPLVFHGFGGHILCTAVSCQVLWTWLQFLLHRNQCQDASPRSLPPLGYIRLFFRQIGIENKPPALMVVSGQVNQNSENAGHPVTFLWNCIISRQNSSVT